MLKRLRAGLAVGAVATATIGLSASAAGATHTHVVHLGNGSCVVLGGEGHEDEVALPGTVADPSVYPDGRQHPLHVLVHQGEPGDNATIEVLGSDTCTSYVNG